jgi:hypothetical protein
MAGKPAARAEQDAVATLGWPVSPTHGNSVFDYEVDRQESGIGGVRLELDHAFIG